MREARSASTRVHTPRGWHPHALHLQDRPGAREGPDRRKLGRSRRRPRAPGSPLPPERHVPRAPCSQAGGTPPPPPRRVVRRRLPAGPGGGGGSGFGLGWRQRRGRGRRQRRRRELEERRGWRRRRWRRGAHEAAAGGTGRGPAEEAAPEEHAAR